MSGEPTSAVCVLTPPGRGAIAVVAAVGAAAFTAVDASFTAANGRHAREQPVDGIVFGHWSSGDHREEVVLVRTAEMSLEVHCHGGAAAVARIVSAMTAAGCQELPWIEWISRDGVDSIAAEAEIALAQASTRRTAAILLDQRNGALARAMREVRESIERGEVETARARLKVLIDRGTFGLHLTTPWQVAIAGRPNVGKSSLINALVGYQRAIVYDQPGTTRDVLTAETAINGWPVRIADAAGIRATDDPLEAEGVARARQQLARADLVLWVVDATATGNVNDVASHAEEQLQAEAAEGVEAIRPLIVLNKIDLHSEPQWKPANNVIAVSAKTGAGLDNLLAAIADRLVPSPPAAGDAVPFTVAQLDRLKSAAKELEHGTMPTALSRLARA